MHRSLLFPAALAAGSACSFDPTGVPDSSYRLSQFGEDSETLLPFPTTGADTPTEPGEPSTTAALTGGPGPSDETTGSPSPGEADTGALPASCGDGVVSGDEECDAGLGENADDRLCTSTCLNARCGDGHLQLANGEACDAGAANAADPGYDGCSLDCTRGAYCGDGTVQTQDGEECEPKGHDDTEACTQMCLYRARILFVTSETSDGDLGGLAGADQLCNDLAAAASLPGTYRTWLLLDGHTLADRFPEQFEWDSLLNIVNVAGDVLAKSIQGLQVGGPAHAIVYTETGDALPERLVWTNITRYGLTGGDCNHWHGVEGAARVGHTGYMPDDGPMADAWHDARQWTDLGVDLGCDNPSAHLYCLQVAD